MPTKYNVDPYFDDFDKTKNFMKILFRPGRAVQARELTQAQTILQNQISSMASSIFKENSRVLGAELSIKTNKLTLVVNPTDSNATAVDVSTLLGVRIQLVADTTAQATVTDIDATNNRILLDIHGGTFPNTQTFETIDPNTGLGNHSVFFTIDSSHNSMIAHINAGIVYVGGNFVNVTEGHIVVDSTPTMVQKEFSIGYNVIEQSVDSIADISLVDNATGSFNYNAPGADRANKHITLGSYEVIRDAAGVETSTAPTNLNKIMLVKNGFVLSDLIQNIKYSDILDLMASRTADESGNYTTSPYSITVKDQPLTADIQIGEGTSYVKGYKLTNQFTKVVSLPKSRSFSTATNQQFFFAAGAYFDISSFVGLFDVKNEEILTFYNTNNGTGTIVGTAKVLSVINNNFGEVRLYIQDYNNMISSFSSANSVVGSTSGATAIIKVDGLGAPVYNIESKSDAIVDIYGDSKLNNIKSIPATTVSYDIVLNFNNIPESGNGTKLYILNAPDTTTDFYVTNGIYAVVNTASGLPLVPTVDYVVSSVNNQNGGISTLSITTTLSEVAISLIVPMYKSQSSARLKSIHKSVQETVTSDANGALILSTYDILNFVSVEDMTVIASPVLIDHTTYITNNGQTDWNYGFGSITGLVASTVYRITVDHFTHSSSGDYFSVDSYMSLPANLDSVTGFVDLYSKIGSYTTGNKNSYKLINCLDGRQTLTNTANSDKIKVMSQNLQLNYDYYLGRIDKIFLRADGTFGSVSGISSASPAEPTSLTGVMDIAIVYVPPYTHTAEDIAIVVYNNKRYTMPDIGKLETRLQNLEDYVSFGLLEKTADSMSITDANGLNRYKNGIFVDNFKGHHKGNTTDIEYNATMDDIYGGLVPNQIENFNRLAARLSNRVNIQEQTNNVIPALSADTATLKFTEVEFISQKFNSTSINVNPYAAVIWHGLATLNPSSDIWVDTKYLPTQSNTSGAVVAATTQTKNTVSIKDKFTVAYNPWNHTKDPAIMASINASIDSRRAAGIPHNDTTQQNIDGVKQAFNGEEQSGGWVQEVIRRDRTTTTTAVTTSVIPTSSTTSVDNILSSAAIPFMRPRAVLYHLSGMRPNQILQGTFDGIDITPHLTNTKADQFGSCSGTFNIPGGVFAVGTKNLKFFDAEATTDADADYYAKGTLNTRQITTTTIRSFITVTTTRFRSSVKGSNKMVWVDPIAQSFLPIPDNNASGVFLSSVDLFFKTAATDLPVSISIVPTQTGYPTQNIIPFSEVSKLPMEVLVSDNGFVSTNFKFESPVYLEANIEYAIVITSNSNDYRVWYAVQGEPTLLNQAGQTETNRGGLATSKQPYLGVMFKSQNSSTWTADQTADLKFVINRCEFDTTQGTLYFDTEDLTANGNEGMHVARFQPNIHTFSTDGTSVATEYSIDNGTTWTQYQDLAKIYVSETILSTAASNKPFSTRLTLNSNNSWLSPVIDLNRAGYATSINLFPSTIGGTYISKTVQLANPALDLRVMIDLLEPAGSNINVYFSTQTPQVPQSSTNVVSLYSAGVTNQMIGNDVFVYHRNAAGGAVTSIGGFVPTKIDNLLTYASNISNVDMFVAPASSVTYANVDKVFYCAISNLSSTPDWVAGTHSIGSYVFHTNKLWKALATTTASPVVNSVDWVEVPSMSTTDALTTHAEIVWRPLMKDLTLAAGVDPSKNFYTYTMSPDSVIEEAFDRFAIKIVLISSNNAITPRAQNLRAIAAT